MRKQECMEQFSLCIFFFFFQAEDGIRDVERSRGLGDVYKRQQRRVHGRIRMNKKILYFLMLVLLIGIIGCSDDNSTSPEADYQNLDIPDGFNWTNLEYVKLNISLEDTNVIGKNLVVVRHNSKVLVRKFMTDGNLNVNVNSVKGYDNLIVEVPANISFVDQREVRNGVYKDRKQSGLQAGERKMQFFSNIKSVSYTHLRAHETSLHLVCRLLLEKKKKKYTKKIAPCTLIFA
eukprot:TRINITY_DN31877_c0_g1_i1.p1 TRINITY_DN31877_c0_g1~~TRINITY_DN31877_c0_g1_i1.p1  ORF type:complete len:233 (+),score=44.74 TRINITY_DN31877_c0_g1_i1:84-782(+)